MKTVIFNLLATATLVLAAPAPLECDIVCVEPSQHDPEATSLCNCAEKYCPTPQGPGGPIIPFGDVWGWNEATDSCGAVPAGDQCAGLDVTCVSGYSYGWNGVDTCQCLPLDSKRSPTGPICDIACIIPSAHDANAIPTNCNCDERHCPPPPGPGGPRIPAGETWAFNATSDTCGFVFDPEAECLSLGVDCVNGYTYGWDASTSSCMCSKESINKRQAICEIACILPEAHDPHAISPGCNCAERLCPPGPECPVNTSFGWDQKTDACGCVASPEAQCVAADISCVPSYIYGWNAVDATCQCLAERF